MIIKINSTVCTKNSMNIPTWRLWDRIKLLSQWLCQIC